LAFFLLNFLIWKTDYNRLIIKLKIMKISKLFAAILFWLFLICHTSFAEQKPLIRHATKCVDTFPENGTSKLIDLTFKSNDVSYWTIDNKTEMDAVIVAKLNGNDIAEVYIERYKKAVYTIPFEKFDFLVFAGTEWCGREHGFNNGVPPVKTARPSVMNAKFNKPFFTEINTWGGRVFLLLLDFSNKKSQGRK
jgi:hypothetical protein